MRKKRSFLHKYKNAQIAFLEQITHFHHLKEKYEALKKASPEMDILVELRQEIKMIKRNLKHEWRQWSKLSKNILSFKALPN